MAICAVCQFVPISDYGGALLCEECMVLIRTARETIGIARRDGVNGPHAYPPNYWRTDPESHTEHATTHIYKFRRGDTTEDHLAHAICRLVMEYARGQS